MASAAQPTARTQQQKRRDRQIFFVSDDSNITKQILATHAPDGRDVEVQPILLIIEDILHRSRAITDGVTNGANANVDTLEEKASAASLDGLLEALAFTIYRLSCEVWCKSSGGGDAHATTLVLLNSVSSYSWDAKVVLTLAAFIVNYGEFWLVIDLAMSNPLARAVAQLKQLPNILENSASLKSRFDALNGLLKAILEIAKCIAGFTEIPTQYISEEMPPMSVAIAHIPTAAYWTIRSMVACASQITSLIGMSQEYSMTTTAETWELSSLDHKVQSILGLLKHQIDLCHQHIGDKKQAEAFHMLQRLFDTPHIDNKKILRALIYTKGNHLPLFDPSNSTSVHVEVFKRKHVLLLISDLDISGEEITILDQIYGQSRTQPELQYDIVWLPIVERATWSKAEKVRFQQKASTMPWPWLQHPELVEPAVARYIKEVWGFQKRIILVVIDPQGRVACPNAVHMLWIWGNLAYPFTVAKEDALWRQESWTLELLIDGIDPAALEWIAEGKIVCLYGGEDLEWIRKFTAAARGVAEAAGEALEMIYVGDPKKAKERLRKIFDAIEREQLSHVWEDPTMPWFFWTRLESMLYSKMVRGGGGGEGKKEGGGGDGPGNGDPIMREAKTMLSFHGGDECWAVVGRGAAGPVARAKGEAALESLGRFEDWKDSAGEKGLVPALADHLRLQHSPQHCSRLILPGIDGPISEKVVCAECSRPMEQFIMYRCCTD